MYAADLRRGLRPATSTGLGSSPCVPRVRAATQPRSVHVGREGLIGAGGRSGWCAHRWSLQSLPATPSVPPCPEEAHLARATSMLFEAMDTREGRDRVGQDCIPPSLRVARRVGGPTGRPGRCRRGQRVAPPAESAPRQAASNASSWRAPPDASPTPQPGGLG